MLRSLRPQHFYYLSYGDAEGFLFASALDGDLGSALLFRGQLSFGGDRDYHFVGSLVGHSLR